MPSSLCCRASRRTVVSTLVACLFAPHALAQNTPPDEPASERQNPAEVLELPTIEVIGTTPLPGIGTPLKEVPANVQVYSSKEIEKQKTIDITEYLERNPNSVTINSGQNNPFQPDLSFRGFSASPLLGTPQGLSVFVDGVRANESFGDVVNWDLIPQSAIANIQVIPGSNPVFGLNTLGGAVAIYTKSGRQFPGASAQAYAGSWDRKAVEGQFGGVSGAFDYFVTANFFDEEGWREHSPSTVKQLFSKFGIETEKTDFDWSFLYVDNKLEGVQATPRSFLDKPEEAYSWPDRTKNRLFETNLNASHFITDDMLLGGNVYYKKLTNSNFASNVNDEILDDPLAPEALNEQSKIEGDTFGGALQATFTNKFAGKKNQFVVGASVDSGKTDFTQEEQDAEFTDDRGTTSDAEFERETEVEGKNNYYGLYFTDTWSVTDIVSLTLSGRYNRAKVKIRDLSGTEPELNGDHTFSRFNPAVGVTINPTAGFTAYATYNEGMRAPTASELTCADPEAPCRLPNSFLADPPLKKVVAKTFEFGVRGKSGDAFNYSAALFRTDLTDDIQFISAGGAASNVGFFQNIGKTRRQGVELGAGATFGKALISARYTYLDATFETSFTASSPANSEANADGEIAVRAGDKIPGVPQHNLKARLDYDFSDMFSMGVTVVYASKQFARGDENNADENGEVPGYTIVNLDGRWNITKQLQLFARVNNVFDREYENFGVLGPNFFNGPGRTFDPNAVTDEQFRSSGAPRGIWVGLRYQFDAPKRAAKN